MKKLLLTLSLVLSVNAFSMEVVLNQSQAGYWSTMNAQFEINPEMERAWVALNLSKSIAEDIYDSNEDKIKIPGMRFDTTRSQIIVTEEGREVVCANLIEKGRGIFRRQIIQTTGECVFENRVVTRQVDDGFYVRTKKYEQFVFITK
jgi:hypothetical protein